MKFISTNFHFSRGCFFVPFVGLLILGIQNLRATGTDNHLSSPSDKTSCNCDATFSQYTELMSLYNDLDGSNWTIKWNLNMPASTWHGVTFNEQCHIVEIALVNNNLRGIVPNVDFPNLTFFDLRNNQLNGTLPNFSLPKVEILNVDNNNLQGTIPTFANCPDLFILGISDNDFEECPDLSAHPNLIKILANGNKFTFEDIIPNETDMHDGYSPQQLLPVPADATLPAGSNYTITIPNFDAAISTNVYEWFKDGISVGVGNGQSLTLSNVNSNDAGMYMLKVSNPNALELTLSSHTVTISVIPMSGSGICDQDDLMVPIIGQSLYHAKQTLTSTATVSSATTFKAGTSITLQPGFHATNSTDFLATIENCANSLHAETLPISSKQAINTTLYNSINQLTVFPNPFAATTTIAYTLEHPSSVQIALYDVSGQQLQILENTTRAKGAYQVRLDGAFLGSGLYFLKVVLGDAQLVEKVYLVK